MSDSEREGGSRLRFAAVVVALALAPSLALAYIDPGNGAYMVQALFALVGAAFFYLRHPIRSLKTFWQWTRERVKPPAPIVEVADGMQAANGVSDPDGASPSLQERH